MKINQDHLEEVGTLTDINPNDLTKNGFRKKITRFYFYLIQFALFIFSSLVGVAFGLYSKSIASYPYSVFPERYIYGPIILAITHGGNLGLSFQLSRKKRLIMKKSEHKELALPYIYQAIFLNIFLSTISLFAIHNLVFEGRIFTIGTMYGVYENKDLNIKKIEL